MFDECKTIAKTEVEGLIAQNPAEAKMSARERKFFNEIKKKHQQVLLNTCQKKPLTEFLKT